MRTHSVSRGRAKRLVGLGIVTMAMLALLFAGAAEAATGPRVKVRSIHYPTNFKPGAISKFEMFVENDGDEPTSGPLSITINFPPGMSMVSSEGFPFECTGTNVVICTSNEPMSTEPPFFVGTGTFVVSVEVGAGLSGPQEVTYSSSGGGAPEVSGSEVIEVSNDEPPFGVTSGTFNSRFLNADGSADRQAGGHPYAVTTEFRLNSRTLPNGQVVPSENVKSIHVENPPGLYGNPQAFRRCNPSELATNDPVATDFHCPIDSQVGVVQLYLVSFGSFFFHPTSPIYNMDPGTQYPGSFGFNFLTLPVGLNAKVRTATDNGLNVNLEGVSSAIQLLGSSFTLWGVPGESSHDVRRYIPGYRWGTSANGKSVPFLSLPSDCTDPELTTTLSIESYESPGVRKSYKSNVPGMTECDRLSVEPELSVTPNPADAASPDGIGVDIGVPQVETAHGRSTPPLRSVKVTLPEGMTLSSSSAGGLAACADSQIHLGSEEDSDCPPASKVAGAVVETPVLAEPLRGAIYLGTQRPGELMPLYLVLRGAGMVLKTRGHVDRDPRTGQVTTVFPETPQLPYSHLHLQFKTGARAPLTNPSICGTYTVTGEFTPWSGGAPVPSSDSFAVGSGPNGGPCPNGSFQPKLSAGTANPAGGKFSSFTLRVSRDDGTAPLGTIQATLPKGLLGKLAGIPYCSDATLASIPSATGTGTAELGHPSCPAASRVGTASVGAGSGPSPFYAKGEVYLAGPYKGAPLSLAVVTPAVAGPFDLGNVVVRNALRVDPLTTEITAVSDPLPTILEGIPLDLKDVVINIDRSEFTVNPTSCDPMSIGSLLGSSGGATASPSVRFQVAGCERLAFKPKLALNFTGQTKRTGNPALKAVLTQPKGENANIAGTTVILPKSMFIDQSHVNNPCTRVQFNADACPAKSVLGTATAWSPLLDQPLTGPVYFRSNGGERKLPDLVADLDGQIHVTLVGFIDSVKVGKEGSRVRTRFQEVPDAPVSRFVLQLKGGKRGLIENSVDLCKAPQKASVKTTGQNGKAFDFEQKLGVKCKKGGKKKH